MLIAGGLCVQLIPLKPRWLQTNVRDYFFAQVPGEELGKRFGGRLHRSAIDTCMHITIVTKCQYVCQHEPSYSFRSSVCTTRGTCKDELVLHREI